MLAVGRTVAQLHRFAHGLHARLGQQRHGAAAEAAARHARAALVANGLLQHGHQVVHRGYGDLEVLAHGPVRLGHQPAHRAQVAGGQGLRSLLGAGVLRDDMVCTAPGHGIECALCRKQLRQRGIAQGRHAQVRGSGLALLAPFVVGAVQQPAPHVRVNDHHRHTRRQRHGGGGEAAAVDQEGVAGLPARRNQLVHDPALTADEAVLGALGQQRDVGGPQVVQRVQGLQQRGHGHLQRGRRRQARALRHITGNGQLHALQRHSALAQHLEHAAHVVRPGMPGAAGDGRIDAELVHRVAEVAGGHADHGVAARARGHQGLEVDRAGQHEAVVVVGVLADQVDTAGGLHQRGGGRVEGADEGGQHTLLEGVVHGG